MVKYSFTVDAKLLRELGERLVGRPHIALSELIKNAYDADARLVELLVERDRIVVTDDGHGMSHRDFIDRWMRIGTPQKQRDRLSPELGRPLTGSKGVGRLSAQLLSARLEVTSVALKNPALAGHKRRASARSTSLHREVAAHVDWEEAIDADKLTDAQADVVQRSKRSTFAGGSHCGTRIELTDLRVRWNAQRFRQLARELWSLQPPFATRQDSDAAFRIEITSDYPTIVETFQRQMSAILDIWSAKVSATLRPSGWKPPPDAQVHELRPHADFAGADQEEPDEPDEPEEPAGELRHLEVTVAFDDGSDRVVVFPIEDCLLDSVSYEVRVYADLEGRQPEGLKVGHARRYLNRFGGVHVYDGGFDLPYYGVEHDWLNIEQDHARRLSESKLLPEALQVSKGLQELPPVRRLFGVVEVSTTQELRSAPERGVPAADALTIQITRDRLVSNAAYAQLQTVVRAGVHLYANERKRRKYEDIRRKRQATPPPKTTVQQLRDAVDEASEDLPPETAKALKSLSTTVADQVAQLEESTRSHTALLGALATAGMTSLAYEHELSKQLESVRLHSEELAKLAGDAPEPLRVRLREISESLSEWRDRARRIRAVFTPLLDEETRTQRGTMPARSLIQDVADQVGVLARGTEVDASGVPARLRLPSASYAAWSAVFQNLFINAFNAVLDSDERRVDVDGGTEGVVRWIRVQDTGVGIDLGDAARLFEPFERGAPIAPERAALGLGGSGLGLTIARTVVEGLGCQIAFEPPDSAHATAVRITWEAEG